MYLENTQFNFSDLTWRLTRNTGHEYEVLKSVHFVIAGNVKNE